MVQLLVAFAVAAGVLLLYVSCRDAPTAAPRLGLTNMHAMAAILPAARALSLLPQLDHL